MTPKAHPDRLAETLAHRAALLHALPSGIPEAVSRQPAQTVDARVDLQLLRFKVQRALRDRGTEAAIAALSGLDSTDFTAGTIQDGTARGLMARLEESLSLCEPLIPSPDDSDPIDHPHTEIFHGKDLRRKRDILIASGGARIRVSRKTGCLLVDRKQGIHEEHCIQFEDQTDVGCLDHFQPADGQRPRLFSPAFLKPSYLHQGPIEDRLVLEGQLGRGHRGYPCKITFIGRKEEPGIRMSVWILNQHRNHRLRIRFAGLQDPAYISHHGTPGFELVHARGRTFLAATLVRACGRLQAGDDFVSTPAAQVIGPIEHQFGLGLHI